MIRWLTFAGVNLVFVLLHPSLRNAFPDVPGVVQALGIGLVLFVLPSVGWIAAKQSTRWLGLRLFSAGAISIAVFLAAIASARAFQSAGSAAFIWNVLWVVANAGFLYAFGGKRGPDRRRSLTPRELVLATALFLTSFGFFYWGATRVVPPQVDHDLEVMATGYGLITRFEPLLLTDRGGVYFFAHPPLLHFVVGGSFALHGNLEELGFYDRASDRARTAKAVDDTADARRVEQEELNRIYDRYRSQPHQRDARTPNVFLAAVAVALLGLWCGRIAKRWWIGVLVAAVYATSPEVFVRSSYGGYFAIGSLASLVILLTTDRWRRWPDWQRATVVMIACALTALADHKLILLPAAIALHDALRAKAGGARIVWLHPTLLGFAAGLAVFWIWGLVIAPEAFIRDHVLDHFVQRIAHVNPLGYEGYATQTGLWWEFIRHTAYVLVPAALAFLIYDLWIRRANDAASRGVWLTWILLAGIAFTVVDWRMTKHIIPLIIPILLALTPPRRAPTWRVAAAGVVLGVAVVLNISMLNGLVRDFASFAVTPAW